MRKSEIRGLRIERVFYQRLLYKKTNDNLRIAVKIKPETEEIKAESTAS